jgi:two-component system response regulator PilR (NtrC family)
LYYRLNVIPVFLPALRARKDDIPLLTGYFLARYSRQMNKSIKRISEKALRMLHEYDWPGNVRELENIIQRHVALCEAETIDTLCIGGDNPKAPTSSAHAFSLPRELVPPGGLNLEAELERYEREYLLEALERTGGNLTNAARLLGMTYRSIRYRVKKLNVKQLLKQPAKG